MCGILGLVTRPGKYTSGTIRALMRRLYHYSESRGKEASGIALLNGSRIHILKQALPASKLVGSGEYQDIENHIGDTDGVAIIGHARLVTNGLLEDNRNNQPVVRGLDVMIHNGIITNDREVWESLGETGSLGGLDSEALLALVQSELGHHCTSETEVRSAMRRVFERIRGTASIALMRGEHRQLVLATNNGSLYIARDPVGDLVVFASELSILKKALAKISSEISFSYTHLARHESLVIDVSDAATNSAVPDIKDLSQYSSATPSDKPLSLASIPGAITPPVEFDYAPLMTLKRCRRCVLPFTMPFIEFNEQGVCNYCINYRPMQVQGEVALTRYLDDLAAHTTPDQPFLFPLSGGRDSCFALHYLKTTYDLPLVAYSYDWGMLTDLGRRNQARMCGALGVEHILVSADIRQKREYIRRNVTAWLRRPDLGTVPLFMAGDKQYFYHANRLRKELGARSIIYSENPLEKTDFKSGFCGVAPQFAIDHVYNLGLVNKLKLGGYYLGQFIQNPALINPSLWDTFTAYLASYFTAHDYLYVYRYKRWDEQEINDTLIREYDWELALDTVSTWRIGDGTAALYNYIYTSVAGFCENDTFRSNQIREGILTRDEALSKLSIENQPRWPSIKWYCDIVGLDFETVIRKISSIKRRTSPVAG